MITRLFSLVRREKRTVTKVRERNSRTYSGSEMRVKTQFTPETRFLVSHAKVRLLVTW